MSDKEIMQKVLYALNRIVNASDLPGIHPKQEAIAAIAMLYEHLDAQEKINENNIVLDPNAQKLYTNGKEFNMESYSFTSTPSSEFVEIKLLVNFDKPIGEQL
jgi:hypothetical protein